MFDRRMGGAPAAPQGQPMGPFGRTPSAPTQGEGAMAPQPAMGGRPAAPPAYGQGGRFGGMPPWAQQMMQARQAGLPVGMGGGQMAPPQGAMQRIPPTVQDILSRLPRR